MGLTQSKKKEASAATADKPSCCCPAGALPALADTHKPQGRVHTLPANKNRNVPCELYIAGESKENNTDENENDNDSNNSSSWKDKPVIVITCDIFGPASGMHRKLADEFASRTKGIVVIPDLFEGKGGILSSSETELADGKPKPLGFNLMTFKFVFKFLFGGAKAFMQQFTWKESAQPMFVEQLIPYLESRGCSKFALLGFCYGAWVNFKACSSTDSDITKHITCALSFHPSVAMIEKDFGGDDLELCKTCTVPQLVHSTNLEPDSWKPDHEAHKLLQENANVTDVSFTMAPSSQPHGFMTRADINDPEACQAIQAGVDMACDFLQKHNK